MNVDQETMASARERRLARVEAICPFCASSMEPGWEPIVHDSALRVFAKLSFYVAGAIIVWAFFNQIDTLPVVILLGLICGLLAARCIASQRVLRCRGCGHVVSASRGGS